MRQNGDTHTTQRSTPCDSVLFRAMDKDKDNFFEKVPLDINTEHNWHIWRLSGMQWSLGAPLASFQKPN